jgi:hypothetical protein
VHENVTCGAVAAVPSLAGRIPVDPLVKPAAVLVKLQVVRFGNPEAVNCTLAGKAVAAGLGVMVMTVLAIPPGITDADVGLADSVKFAPTVKDATTVLVPPAVVTEMFPPAPAAIVKVAVSEVLLVTFTFVTVIPAGAAIVVLPEPG